MCSPSAQFADPVSASVINFELNPRGGFANGLQQVSSRHGATMVVRCQAGQRATFSLAEHLHELDPRHHAHYPFQRLWGGYKNPYDQVEYAEELGLGTRKYRLVEIMPPALAAKMQPPKLVYEGQPTFY